MRENVTTSARGWKAGVIGQTVPPHAQCRRCGGNIWFGQVTFKGKAPSWIAYSHAGHGGGGLAAVVRHDCSNPAHVADRPQVTVPPAPVEATNHGPL